MRRRSRFFTLLLVGLLARGAWAQSRNRTDARPPNLKFESYTLKNGLKVVLHQDSSVPRVAVCVAYHVGSKNERAGRTGFAHFFEHMMFRGTKNVPNYDIPLQETGTSSNAFTSEDVTVYHETVPSEFLERALYLEAERLAFLPTALDEAKFGTEREVVKNERRQSYENVPYGLAEETLLARVFPKGHPYSWSVIGSMKDLNSAKLDDLRLFFSEFYHPGNACLSLAGDFEVDAAKTLIEKYFGPLAPGSTPTDVKAGPSKLKPVRVVQSDRVSLPRVHWAWPTVSESDPDAPALDVLAGVLSNGEASRLYRALVRDSKAAKDVDASNDSKEIGGLFTIEATAAEQVELVEVERVLKRELDRLRSEPPTREEVARVIATHEKATYQSLTSPLSRAQALALGYLLKNDPAHYRKDLARYFEVTPRDLARVAEKYLTADKVVLEIIPVQPGQAETEAAEAGPAPEKPGTVVSTPVARVPAKTDVDWSKMPGPSNPGNFKPIRHVSRKLSNGMEVWVAPWRTLPIVDARLEFMAGTADDPPRRSGLALLSSTLLTQGTRNRSSVELTEAFEILGSPVSTSMNLDRTSLNFSVATRNLPAVLDLVTELLSEPRHDPRDFDREKTLQLADLVQGPDSPNWIARRAFRTLLYGRKHPYGAPDQGFVDSVRRLSLNDVIAFRESKFGANHAVLILVGDLEPNATFDLLERTLVKWRARVPEPKPRPKSAEPTVPGIIHLVDKPGAAQSVIVVGRRWVGRSDPSHDSTLVGNHVLGVDFLSRLNQNLREKNGYTYGAGSRFSYRREGSVWQVSTSVRTDATAPALREILGELDGLLKAKPLTEEELLTGRQAVARSFPETFESPSSIASLLGEMAEFDLPPNYSETYLSRISAVTDKSIRTAMASLVTTNDRTILVVGDRKIVEPRLKAIRGIREVRAINPDGFPVGP